MLLQSIWCCYNLMLLQWKFIRKIIFEVLVFESYENFFYESFKKLKFRIKFLIAVFHAHALHKKWSFTLRISSVYVTRFFSFFVQWWIYQNFFKKSLTEKDYIWRFHNVKLLPFELVGVDSICVDFQILLKRKIVKVWSK